MIELLGPKPKPWGQEIIISCLCLILVFSARYYSGRPLQKPCHQLLSPPLLAISALLPSDYSFWYHTDLLNVPPPDLPTWFSALLTSTSSINSPTHGFTHSFMGSSIYPAYDICKSSALFPQRARHSFNGMNAPPPPSGTCFLAQILYWVEVPEEEDTHPSETSFCPHRL